ncbi:MAG: peptide chain release factor N(5)-glutamine methyltransferase [Magnetococcales bacterium]|nr:peptide chain release factor N(5)-glutamine methyltransferase [Magnetococcales bacterium]
MNPPIWTIRALLQWSSPWLARRGIDTPRLDAELLLADTLGLERIGLFLDPDRPLTLDELDAFKSRLKRRTDREPVAYIIGRKEFWKDSFVVDRHVLIPRPETETLLECVLLHFKDRTGPWRFLETGCGSGALLLSLLREFPQARGIGLDISPEALDISQRNALAMGMDRRVQWHRSDLLSALDGTTLSFEAIVANLPYVPRGEISMLQPEIVHFEPHLALDGGDDGLDLVRRFIFPAVSFLAPGGLLALEIDPRQRHEVVSLFEKQNLSGISVLPDCHRVARIVFGFSPDHRTSFHG